tara:strand:+ start:4566 stop:7460 length:2895 start_codon:yes stop_codon:yes gene_type:complete
MSDYLTKQIFYIDASTVSGSTEELRNEIGINWWPIDFPATGIQLYFGASSATVDPAHKPWDTNTSAEADIWLDPINPTSVSGLLQYAELQPLFQEIANIETIIPNFKIPGRFYGTSDILSDTEWKTFLLGGTFADKTYNGIYSEQTFDNYGFEYELPYLSSEATNMIKIDDKGWQTGSISYHYNEYLPKYEEWVSGRDSLKEIPSLAFMEVNTDLDLANLDDLGENFLTRDGATSDVASIITTSEVDTLPPIGAYNQAIVPGPNSSYDYVDITKNLRAHLEDEVPLNDLSEETYLTLTSKTKNIFYNREAAYNLFNLSMDPGPAAVLDSFPYYVSIDFPRSTTYNNAIEDQYFRSAINDAHFSSYLLFLLKKNFTDTTPDTKNFMQYVKQNTSDSNLLYDLNSFAGTSFNTVDFITLLTNGYEAEDTSISDCYFIGPKAWTRSVPPPWWADPLGIKEDNEGSLRFLSSYSTMTVLSKLASYLDSEHSPSPTDMTTYFDMNMEGKNGIYALLDKGGQNNYHETVAYRIEKKSDETVVQNIWIYNSDLLGGDDVFRYRDSQVKYGETYTYTVYAYVLGTGAKYKMGDLRVGRNIGTGSIGALTGVATGAESYCVQFHDPNTNEVVDQLFAAAGQTVGEAAMAQFGDDAFPQLASMLGAGALHGITNPLDVSSSFNSQAQTISEIPYLADFNLYYEPTIRVFEVPIMTNAVTILDNPAAPVEVAPFQKIDNSQEIGFVIKKESQEPTDSFPTIITEDDATYKEEYLRSNDLLETDSLGVKSVSDQATIQIFKMSTKPTSYDDFKDFLYKSISLKIKDTSYYLPTYIFYDKIETNKKYYYLIRFLNEHEEPGAPSPIIEAELVDDGGYKYSIFENLFEKDLQEDVFTNPSTSLKKLLQILPNIDQLSLNTDNVDFAESAESQLSNLEVGLTDDPLFGKDYPSFKVRLTSKKTGKKIDLNLRFNLNEEL